MQVKRKLLLFLMMVSIVLIVGCTQENAKQGSTGANDKDTNQNASEGIVFPEPGKPVMLSTNYGPGGTLQISQEHFKPFWEEELGGEVQIEYIEGAAGLIGYNEVFSRPADGYSIVPSSSTFGPYTYPHLSEEKPPWDYEDWLPLGIYSDIPNSGVVVKDDSKYETFAELILDAREKPGEITIGTIGPGRIEDVQLIELQHVFDVDVNQVHYDGGGTLFTDLLTGDLDAIVTAATQYGDSEDARVLTFLAKEMTDNHPFPEIPTLADWTDELDYSLDEIKTLGATHFNGFFVKKGLPDEVYNKLVEALKNITNNPEWQELVKDYRYPVYRSPEEAKEIFDEYYEGIGEMMELADQYQ